MTKKFGPYGHQKLTIEVTPHMIYWLTNLVIEGIKKRRADWSEGGKKPLDFSDQMSLASFCGDLRKLVSATVLAIVDYKPEPPKGKRKKGK